MFYNIFWNKNISIIYKKEWDQDIDSFIFPKRCIRRPITVALGQTKQVLCIEWKKKKIKLTGWAHYKRFPFIQFIQILCLFSRHLSAAKWCNFSQKNFWISRRICLKGWTSFPWAKTFTISINSYSSSLSVNYVVTYVYRYSTRSNKIWKYF